MGGVLVTIDATDSNPVFCQFESDIRYARVAQRKRHSIKDAESVGSNPTLCTGHKESSRKSSGPLLVTKRVCIPTEEKLHSECRQYRFESCHTQPR